MTVIKSGVAYRSKDDPNVWCIVGVNRKGMYQCRIVEWCDGDYDEEIADMSYQEIEKEFDIEECFTPICTKKDGLLAVWDGGNRDTIILVQDTKEARKFLAGSGFRKLREGV